MAPYWTGLDNPIGLTFDTCFTSWNKNPPKIFPVATSASSIEGNSDLNMVFFGFDNRTTSYQFSTKSEPNPWWKADFGSSKNISQVRVQGGQGGNIKTVEVRLGDSPNHKENPVFDKYSGDTAMIVFKSPHPKRGRYLSLEILDSDSNVLTICDIKFLEQAPIR